MSNADQILTLLKTQGPLSAADLGKQLSLTSMGARKHLQTLEDQGLVYWQEQAVGRGRPKRTWHLSGEALQRFPDRHSELSLQLIESIESLYGEPGLEKLISHREQQQYQQYQQALSQQQTLQDKVSELARLRNQEGYMAECVTVEEGCYRLLEHHCPICAAASKCKQFCRAELQLFQALLDDLADVEREQYLLEGDLRCSYLIRAH